MPDTNEGTVTLVYRVCVRCRKVSLEYDTGDAARIGQSMRRAFPRIMQGCRVCVPCDNAQHSPSEIRTFQLEAGMNR